MKDTQTFVRGGNAVEVDVTVDDHRDIVEAGVHHQRYWWIALITTETIAVLNHSNSKKINFIYNTHFILQDTLLYSNAVYLTKYCLNSTLIQDFVIFSEKFVTNRKNKHSHFI